MDNGLSYFIPHHGRAKISLRVPESHRLNVCPAACGRRDSLREGLFRPLKRGARRSAAFELVKKVLQAPALIGAK